MRLCYYFQRFDLILFQINGFKPRTIRMKNLRFYVNLTLLFGVLLLFMIYKKSSTTLTDIDTISNNTNPAQLSLKK